MNKQRAATFAIALAMAATTGGPAFASGSSSGGGKATDPTSTTATASGKAGGCSPFVAYVPSVEAPSIYSTSPAVLVKMTLTNCAGGGTPVYSITTTVSDPSGVRPDYVQRGSYCVRGGVTYDVNYYDSQVDPGQSYVVTTVVTASNGQVVDSRSASITTPV